MSFHFASQLTMDFGGLKEFGTSHHKLVRKNDPDTSKEAAKAVDSTRLEAMVYSAIKQFGTDGCISDEIRDLFTGMPYSSITARYRALLDKGLIIDTGARRPGKSGRRQRVMKVINVEQHSTPL